MVQSALFIPSGRSLNPLKGSLNHRKKVTLNHQEGIWLFVLVWSFRNLLSTTSTSYSYSSNGFQRDIFKETSSCWPAVSKTACQQSKTNFCSKKKGSTLQNPQLEETFQFQWYFQGPLIIVRGPTFFSPGFVDTNSMKKNSPNCHLHRSSCKGLLAGSWAPQINRSTSFLEVLDDDYLAGYY